MLRGPPSHGDALKYRILYRTVLVITRNHSETNFCAPILCALPIQTAALPRAPKSILFWNLNVLDGPIMEYLPNLPGYRPHEVRGFPNRERANLLSGLQHGFKQLETCFSIFPDAGFG